MTTIAQPIPITRPTVARAMLALTARDLRVMRRALLMNIVRIVLQPLLFVFVFAYVLPEIGAAPGGSGLSTIMIPGLVGSTMIMQSMASIVFPLVMELAGPGAIEDRVLAPLPVHLIAVQRIVTAMIEGLFAGILVFPVALFVHSGGQQPAVDSRNWPLLVVVMLAGALLSASLGMFLGATINPRQVQVLFTLVMFPAMMLGCVYFTWASLAGVRWLQIAVLINPMVYLDEGLRAALTPQVGHLATWAFLLVLVGGAALFTWLSIRLFVRRVTK
ncbi:MAG TPA: ABC transporter permease [Pseudonocardiaceae bacterium]|jgi:ABC-2 type transport system permease protein|nr:ABC transporter permease [Pseudonocardiaceae bacterium]